MKIRWVLPIVAALALVAATACVEEGEGRGGTPEVERPAATAPFDGTEHDSGVGYKTEARVAVAQLEPTSHNEARGRVVFREVDGGIQVEAEIEGLNVGNHGFHIHERGDCSAPDASSAGEHFAPDAQRHGGPDDAEGQRHAGDLGNIEVTADGTARYERVVEMLSLDGASSIVGKSVIVHAMPDDLETQPSGGSGARLACGVIELEEPGAEPSTAG
jgi:Cu-Zn family superoxide dismutase